MDNLFTITHVMPIPYLPQDSDRAYPERRLYVEILAGAARDLRLGPLKLTKVARDWITRGNVAYVTFNSACSFLGLDVSATRKQLLSGLPLIVKKRR